MAEGAEIYPILTIFSGILRGAIEVAAIGDFVQYNVIVQNACASLISESIVADRPSDVCP